MDIDFEPIFNDVIFIFDNTFKKYNENDNAKFWKFYDISNRIKKLLQTNQFSIYDGYNLLLIKIFML
jgi:hypothetical protein